MRFEQNALAGDFLSILIKKLCKARLFSRSKIKVEAPSRKCECSFVGWDLVERVLINAFGSPNKIDIVAEIHPANSFVRGLNAVFIENGLVFFLTEGQV